MIEHRYELRIKCDGKNCRDVLCLSFWGEPNMTAKEILSLYSYEHDSLSTWMVNKEGKIFCSSYCEEGL